MRNAIVTVACGSALALSSRAKATRREAGGDRSEKLAARRKVENVAVAAMPEEVLGERASAFVISNDSTELLTLDEMIECIDAAKLVKYKWPERLVIVDAFPMNVGGRVQKAAMTALVSSTAVGQEPEQVTR